MFRSFWLFYVGQLVFFVFVQVEKGRAVCSRCWLCIKMDSGSFSLFFAWTLFTLFWIFLRSFKVVFGCLFSVVFGFSSKFGHCSLFQLFFSVVSVRFMLLCGCLVSWAFSLWFWLLVHCCTVTFLSCFNCFRLLQCNFVCFLICFCSSKLSSAVFVFEFEKVQKLFLSCFCCVSVRWTMF